MSMRSALDTHGRLCKETMVRALFTPIKLAHQLLLDPLSLDTLSLDPLLLDLVLSFLDIIQMIHCSLIPICCCWIPTLCRWIPAHCHCFLAHCRLIPICCRWTRSVGSTEIGSVVVGSIVAGSIAIGSIVAGSVFLDPLSLDLNHTWTEMFQGVLADLKIRWKLFGTWAQHTKFSSRVTSTWTTLCN